MTITYRLLATALLMSQPLLALAVDEHHPQQPEAVQAASQPAPARAQEQAVAEQMKKMQDIHDRIAAATTPEARQAAMHEGMQAMKEGLGMLQSGCPGQATGQPMMMDQRMMHMMMQMMDQQAAMMGAGGKMQGMPMQPPAQ